jgi:hypothetical protein
MMVGGGASRRRIIEFGAEKLFHFRAYLEIKKIPKECYTL